MSDPVAFLAARYAEEWAAARDYELALGLDTSRATRDVDAKRAILEAHGPDPIGKYGSPRAPLCLVCLTDREGYEEQWEGDPWPCLTLRHLLAVYQDHPDYDPEWKP